MNTTSHGAAASQSGLTGLIERILNWLDRVPYSLLAIPARLAVAEVFWSSFSTKIQNWDTTVALFEDEYKLPLLSPDAAAHLTAGIEATSSILLVLGLLTRPVAFLLLGMSAYIEAFIYPRAWPTHIQWAAMLVFLLCRGPGKVSLDYLIKRWLGIGEAI
ncbi:MAG TPA: DoxX family protein [Steroidobacteraceae bacterium]|nr:DoxX family protein [Steroidobacteraceae bacterium]